MGAKNGKLPVSQPLVQPTIISSPVLQPRPIIRQPLVQPTIIVPPVKPKESFNYLALVFFIILIVMAYIIYTQRQTMVYSPVVDVI